MELKVGEKAVSTGDKGQLYIQKSFIKFLINLYICLLLLKTMYLYGYARKDIGNLGEGAVCEYLRRLGFTIVARNVTAKMGELDVVAQKGDCMHVVEVKSVRCLNFPDKNSNHSNQCYDPAENLHRQKIQKVIRTAQWYIARNHWEGEWQIDGALVWLREQDGVARINYYPQIV